MMCQHENCYSENSLVDIVFKNDNLCGKSLTDSCGLFINNAKICVERKNFALFYEKLAVQTYNHSRLTQFDSVWQEWKEHAPLFAKFLATSKTCLCKRFYHQQKNVRLLTQRLKSLLAEF